MVLGTERTNTVRQTTEFEYSDNHQIYFKDQARVAALTATLLVPVLFNSVGNADLQFVLTPKHQQIRFTNTTELNVAIGHSEEVRSSPMSIAELSRTLFPAPVELTRAQTTKHRAAISSFFKKS